MVDGLLSAVASPAAEPGSRAHGLGYPTARGIFLDQGSNPCLLHWQVDSGKTNFCVYCAANDEFHFFQIDLQLSWNIQVTFWGHDGIKLELNHWETSGRTQVFESQATHF